MSDSKRRGPPLNADQRNIQLKIIGDNEIIDHQDKEPVNVNNDVCLQIDANDTDVNKKDCDPQITVNDTNTIELANTNEPAISSLVITAIVHAW